MEENKTLTGVLKKKNDTYSIVASTRNVDRDGEVILPSAFKNLEQYLDTNPVILGFHNYWDFPIGKATDGKIGDEALVLDIQFAETEKGKEAKYLYDQGFMNSFSVGFIPKEWDIDSEGHRVFTDVELLEVSAVPVPANAAANMIRQAKSKGVELPEFEALYSVDEKKEINAEEREELEEPVAPDGEKQGEQAKRKYLIEYM
jgi:HK97 family phage prohead protease